MRKLSENAILIIGNGFDLAHDMPTSYNDFANYYIEVITNKLISCFNNNNFNPNKFFFDDKFSQYFDYEISGMAYRLGQHGLGDIPNEIKNISAKLYKIYLDNNFTFQDVQKPVIKLFKSEKKAIKYIIKNKFLGKLYNNEYKNWFDIEQSYFFELEYLLKKNNLNQVKQLNNELEQIKKYLKKYLTNIKPKYSNNIENFFGTYFLRKMNIYVINFNYTNTFDSYTNSFRYNLEQGYFTNIDTNHIHGTLKEDIIFGYGDDTNNKYQEIKNKDEDEYLKNFKTTSYLMNNRYFDILSKLEDFKDYETYVIGHSLGRTDKTLLKEIFDNEKCLNIHLFKRNDIEEDESKKSYTSLINNISRILDNEKDVRRKVLSFDLITSFPLENHNLRKQYVERLFTKMYGISILDPKVN